MKVYVAFYDEAEGRDQESWNTFYTPWVAATDRDCAIEMAEEKLKEMIYEDMAWDDENFDTSVAIQDMNETDQVAYRRHRAKYHIEIQEDDLG